VPRWQPDEQLIPAVRTGRCTRTYQHLTPADRCWVVAGLSEQGLTAEKIARLLGCSLRTVRIIKADPMTVVCRTLMVETAAFTSETRLLRSELTAASVALSAAEGETRRLRDRLVRISMRRDEAGVPLCARGLHPMGRYQTYEHNGRRFCRTCHRDDQAKYRARRKVAA